MRRRNAKHFLYIRQYIDTHIHNTYTSNDINTQMIKLLIFTFSKHPCICIHKESTPSHLYRDLHNSFLSQDAAKGYFQKGMHMKINSILYSSSIFISMCVGSSCGDIRACDAGSVSISISCVKPNAKVSFEVHLMFESSSKSASKSTFNSKTRSTSKLHSASTANKILRIVFHELVI